MKYCLSLIGVLFYSGMTFGQYAGDAFRYSEVTQTGTARFQGMGGNHAALGGDISVLFGNPAGLAFYNRSELSISPSLSLLKTQSTYIDNTQSATKSNPTIGQVGLVLAGSARNENRRWRRTALGVTYSRTTDFNTIFTFRGRNNRSSIVDSYIVAANNRNVSATELNRQYNRTSNQANSLEAAAYQLFLINGTDRLDGSAGPPYTRFDANRPTDQRNTFVSSGAASQWSIGYAGNLDDKLYVGASIGLTKLRYEFDNEYNETLVGGQVFRSLGQTDNFTVTGDGINLALGLIYKLDRSLQIGGTLTTPTFSSIKETYRSNIFTDAIGIPIINNGKPSILIPDNQSINVTPNEFEYSLTSPLRASAGATYFLGSGKIGFITATADYVGYAGMRVMTNAYSNQDNNAFKEDVKREIQDTYKNVVNFRAGAELRAGLFRFRGGVAYLVDPYKRRFDDLERSKLLISGGLGIRNDRFFMDISGSFNTFKSAYTPYSLPNNRDYASAQINNKLTNLTLSLGVYF